MYICIQYMHVCKITYLKRVIVYKINHFKGKKGKFNFVKYKYVQTC